TVKENVDCHASPWKVRLEAARTEAASAALYVWPTAVLTLTFLTSALTVESVLQAPITIRVVVQTTGAQVVMYVDSMTHRAHKEPVLERVEVPASLMNFLVDRVQLAP
ncbi:hypothetical protein OTU49_013517, partial [Cherax quadricarinatus]